MAANPELREQLEQAISANKVLLLMKATPDMPRCGFSMRTVGVLEQMGVEFIKRPDDGMMKGLAFIKDPDGYWIEILSPNGMTALMGR